MKKLMLAVFVMSLLSSVTCPVQASVGGKKKPPLEQSCCGQKALVASLS